jgi:uncharacterized protein YegP (UPF0339 family)
MKIQIRRTRNRRQPWFWRIVAANGKVMAHSETYSSKRKARAAAWKVWEAMTSGNCSVEEEA